MPCLAYSGRLDSLAGWYGDDFYTEGEPGALDEVDEMFLASFKAKVLPGASTEGTILRRILLWSPEGVQVSSRSRVRNRVRHQVPEPLVAGSAIDVLDLLTAAEGAVFRRGTGTALCLGQDRFDLQFATKELAQDMQAPSKLSMLGLRRFVRYLLGAADVGPFFAYQDEPSTVLVWTDVDWSGDAATCKSTSAGAVQLGSHTIETWSVNQQVVWLSSAESEFHAIGSGCVRGLTVKHVSQEILHVTLMSR